MKTAFTGCLFQKRSLSILTGCEQEVSENKMSKEEINSNSQTSRRIKDQITPPPPTTQLFKALALNKEHLPPAPNCSHWKYLKIFM